VADEKTLQDRAHQMRREPTEPEKRLWRHLSNSQFGGFKFRRQAVIGQRIVDFFCPAIGLIVEIDGDTHDADVDARRDRKTAELGFSVLRVTNADVMSNMNGVLTAILARAQSLPARWSGRPPPQPTPAGGGG
jgi:very-short-patch-repair endonuclease